MLCRTRTAILRDAAYPFYGGPPVRPDTRARASVAELVADMDAEGTERALIMPNYGVPYLAVAFSFNELCVEAAGRDDRIRAALWVSPLPRDAERTRKTLALAGEPGVRALKLSFLLGGRPDEEASGPARRDLRRGARAGPGGPCAHLPRRGLDIDAVGTLVDSYAEQVAVHLVHFGGGMSGHIKLAGSRFFDWIAAGQRVYTDLSGPSASRRAGLPTRCRGAGSGTTGSCSLATSPGATMPGSTPDAAPRPAAGNSLTWYSGRTSTACTDNRGPLATALAHKEMNHG